MRTAYEALRDAMYNNEPVQPLEELFARGLAALGAAALAPEECTLWESRLEYMLARGYQAAGDKRRAAAHYERGLSLAEQSLCGHPSSEGWRMMSEHIGQLCLVKDLRFLLVNGLKVVGCAEKALALNTKNPAAQIIIAAGKVYPPALFGGNPRQGIELMQRALAMGAAERDDLFNIYSGIGLAYGKLKSRAEARRWLLKALELYPGNAFVREELVRLE